MKTACKVTAGNKTRKGGEIYERKMEKNFRRKKKRRDKTVREPNK